jgi:hypothetical protein
MTDHEDMTAQVRYGYADWESDRDGWNKRVAEFDRWLSELEAKIRADERAKIGATAWRDGYYTGKRDYAGSITGGMPISTPNPYETRP